MRSAVGRALALALRYLDQGRPPPDIFCRGSIRGARHFLATRPHSFSCGAEERWSTHRLYTRTDCMHAPTVCTHRLYARTDLLTLAQSPDCEAVAEQEGHRLTHHTGLCFPRVLPAPLPLRSQGFDLMSVAPTEA